MIFFMLPILLAITAIASAIVSAIVFAVAFSFIRKPSALPNRFGSVSETKALWPAIFGAFKRMFDFRGRANRLDFSAFAVFAGLVALSCMFMPIGTVSVQVTYGSEGSNMSWGTPSDIVLLITVAIIVALILLILGIASLSMAVRRLHDINRSGWWLLLLFVCGWFVLLYWFLQPPQKTSPVEVF